MPHFLLRTRRRRRSFPVPREVQLEKASIWCTARVSIAAHANHKTGIMQDISPPPKLPRRRKLFRVKHITHADRKFRVGWLSWSSIYLQFRQ